jgi:hypothetical protein
MLSESRTHDRIDNVIFLWTELVKILRDLQFAEPDAPITDPLLMQLQTYDTLPIFKKHLL